MGTQYRVRRSVPVGALESETNPQLSVRLEPDLNGQPHQAFLSIGMDYCSIVQSNLALTVSPTGTENIVVARFDCTVPPSSHRPMLYRLYTFVVSDGVAQGGGREDSKWS